MSEFDAKKEELQRKESKVKQLDISDAKQKDLIKQKDVTIKEAEIQQQKMNEDRDKMQQEITDHKKTLVEQQTKIRELENDKVD